MLLSIGLPITGCSASCLSPDEMLYAGGGLYRTRILPQGKVLTGLLCSAAVAYETVNDAGTRTSCGFCFAVSCLRSCLLSVFTFSSTSLLPGLSSSAC